MHWVSKLFVVVFLVHAGVLLTEVYQLVNIQWPSFGDLITAEGNLILERKGRDQITGIQFADGNKAYFSCRLPGSQYQYCFSRTVVEKYGLDHTPKATIWWYPIEVPLSGDIDRYVFQIQLARDKKPLLSGGGKDSEFSYGYDYRGDRERFIGSRIERKTALAAAYVLGSLLLIIWGHFVSMRKGE